METFSASLALCAGNSRSPVNSPHKIQGRWASMFSLICALNKRLSKQSWGWWFGTPLSVWVEKYCIEEFDEHSISVVAYIWWWCILGFPTRWWSRPISMYILSVWATHMVPIWRVYLFDLSTTIGTERVPGMGPIFVRFYIAHLCFPEISVLWFSRWKRQCTYYLQYRYVKFSLVTKYNPHIVWVFAAGLHWIG